MKLPDIPGMELFKGKSFHTARWDYEYTGGDLHGNLDKLADKVVAVIGNRGERHPVRPAPGASRPSTSTSSSARRPRSACADNRPTPDDFAEGLRPGLAT